MNMLHAAAVLLGVGLLTPAYPVGAWASDDWRVAGFEIRPPDLPEVVVTTDAPFSRGDGRSGASGTAPAPHGAPHDGDLRVPLPPEITVVVEPAAPMPPRVGPAAVEIAPPDLPEVVVTIPAPDPVRLALLDRLTDGDLSLHPRLRPHDREAMLAFYALGDFRPIWVADGTWTARAQAVIARLKRADEDALDPADYPVPAIGVATGDNPTDLAEAELRLGAAALVYARDARGGRIDPSRLSKLMTPTRDLPAADAVLTDLAAAEDAGAALANYNPPHAGYQALKARLAWLREQRPTVRVPRGPALRVGMRDPRVPLIRARFGLGPARGDERTYDERLASVVAAFQKRNGLRPSGVLTRETVAALGSTATARLEADLIANMERWRWLPVELGRRHVFVNVPEFRLSVVEDGRTIHSARVIVGKPETPTPVFSDEMEYIVVNPSWHVPPSILRRDFLPKLAQDPGYAARNGYEVIRRGRQISIRQPPGERNALGFVKFMFPNDHAVYLHDTPGRRLFKTERRAYSAGCIRVEEPFRLAEIVLAGAPGWSEERVRRLVGKGERTIRLTEHIPVHLAYFTAMVDEQGALRRFDDLYGFDKRILSALDLDG